MDLIRSLELQNKEERTWFLLRGSVAGHQVDGNDYLKIY